MVLSSNTAVDALPSKESSGIQWKDKISVNASFSSNGSLKRSLWISSLWSACVLRKEPVLDVVCTVNQIHVPQCFDEHLDAVIWQNIAPSSTATVTPNLQHLVLGILVLPVVLFCPFNVLLRNAKPTYKFFKSCDRDLIQHKIEELVNYKRQKWEEKDNSRESSLTVITQASRDLCVETNTHRHTFDLSWDAVWEFSVLFGFTRLICRRNTLIYFVWWHVNQCLWIT